MNIRDIQQTVFVNEINPRDIYELLTRNWKVGHNLAMAIIANYGGHIFDIFRALRLLEYQGQYFTGTISNVDVSNVEKCLDWTLGKDKVLRDRMISTLKDLLEKGFAPTAGDHHHHHLIEEEISSNNVGSVVNSESTLIVGFPRDFWQKTSARTGLIPTSQRMRIAIAWVFNQNKAKIISVNKPRTHWQ